MINEDETYKVYGYTNEDAPNKTSKIYVNCDYCGYLYSVTKSNRLLSHRNNAKDCCKSKLCIKKKTEETMMLKYGVFNAMHHKEFKDKLASSLLVKYGVDNVFKLKACQQKIVEHWVKQGVQNPSQLQEVKDKKVNTMQNNHGVSYTFELEHVKKASLLADKSYTGKMEQDVRDWINSLDNSFSKNIDIIFPKEIDMYSDKFKLAIEFCGNYWHNEKYCTDKNQHYSKYIQLKDKGIRLITMFEDEWLLKKYQVKNFITSLLKKNSRRIHARDTKVEQVPKEEAKVFIDMYHIQGCRRMPKQAFGIKLGEELLGLISLNTHHRDNSKKVIDRIVFKYDTTVVGGLSKIFSKIDKKDPIITWSDNRWTEGNAYIQLGFKLIKESRPDYTYVNIKNVLERNSKQSHKKSLTGCPKDVKEHEFEKENGYYRMWDCGKKTWEYRNE